MHYEVRLRTANVPVSVDGDKFCCEDDGYTVFYARPAPGEKFEEMARFSTKNVAKIEETKQ